MILSEWILSQVRDQLLLQKSTKKSGSSWNSCQSLHEMEELKRVQELRVDEFSRRRLIENQDTISELTARIQEWQNEVNCMNDTRDFKDAESVRSGPSHVPSQPAFFFFSSAARYLEFAGNIGKRFCKSTGVFSVTLSRRIQSLDF